MPAVLALAPDLSMIGYLAGSRIGSYASNLVHAYVPPLAPGAAGFRLDPPLAMQVAVVWVGHVGTDSSAPVSSTSPGSGTPTSARTNRYPIRLRKRTDRESGREEP